VIKTQVIRENKKPVAVIMDYKEYVRLKEIEEERKDYFSASKVKVTNKDWTSHEDLKKSLGL
jgi:hypothetical protein